MNPYLQEQQNNPRVPASLKGQDSLNSKKQKQTLSDQEITSTFKTMLNGDESKVNEIEKGLGLTLSEEAGNNKTHTSYLASLDEIKEFFRVGRFEKALILTDELIKLYPTDPKLYSMRGTLLDRLGQKELALKAWNQSLRFDPANQGLKNFLERKQVKEASR